MRDDGATGPMGRLVRGGVVALASRRRPGRFGMLDEVHRYWDALRGERLLPLRSEVDPRGIEGALDSAFVVERIAPGIARFRLAGSHLVDLMGAEVRGMPLSVLFAGGSRPALAEAVEGVFSGPETLRLTLSGERGLARPTMAAQMILLPLRSDLGDVTRALGCLASEGPIGRAPRRLVIRAAERVDILDARPAPRPVDRPSVEASSRPLRPTLRAPAPPGAVERIAGTETPRLRPVPGAPHLRVVEGAD